MSRIAVRKTYKLYVGGVFPRSESGRTFESEGQNVAWASPTSRKSYINDATLPEPGRVRKQLNRVVDQLAFGLIKHCLSRAHHQCFDGEELARYADGWVGAGVDQFYALNDLCHSIIDST